MYFFHSTVSLKCDIRCSNYLIIRVLKFTLCFTIVTKDYLILHLASKHRGFEKLLLNQFPLLVCYNLHIYTWNSWRNFLCPKYKVNFCKSPLNV